MYGCIKEGRQDVLRGCLKGVGMRLVYRDASKDAASRLQGCLNGAGINKVCRDVQKGHDFRHVSLGVFQRHRDF